MQAVSAAAAARVFANAAVFCWMDLGVTSFGFLEGFVKGLLGLAERYLLVFVVNEKLVEK